MSRHKVSVKKVRIRSHYLTRYMDRHLSRMSGADNKVAVLTDLVEHHRYSQRLIGNATQSIKEIVRNNIAWANAELEYLEGALVRFPGQICIPKVKPRSIRYQSKVFHMYLVLIAEFDELFVKIESLQMLTCSNSELLALREDIHQCFKLFMDMLYQFEHSIKVKDERAFMATSKVEQRIESIESSLVTIPRSRPLTAR